MANRPMINELKHFVVPPELLRQVREALGWSIATTAEKAGLTVDRVTALESDPRARLGCIDLEDAFRLAGVTFTAFSGLSGSIFKAALPDGRKLRVIRRGALHKRKPRHDG